MNLVVGSAGNSAQQNTLAGGVNAGVDVSLSNFNSSTPFNLSKNGSAPGTAAGVISPSASPASKMRNLSSGVPPIWGVCIEKLVS